MTRARVLVQPDWGMAPNRGWHMVGLDDPTERHRGMRVPLTGKLAGQGKGTGAAPTPLSVEGPKPVVGSMVQGVVDGGTGHHGGGDVAWLLGSTAQRSNR
jgi:hypothetical protein